MPALLAVSHNQNWRRKQFFFDAFYYDRYFVVVEMKTPITINKMANMHVDVISWLTMKNQWIKSTSSFLFIHGSIWYGQMAIQTEQWENNKWNYLIFCTHVCTSVFVSGIVVSTNHGKSVHALYSMYSKLQKKSE